MYRHTLLHFNNTPEVMTPPRICKSFAKFHSSILNVWSSRGFRRFRRNYLASSLAQALATTIYIGYVSWYVVGRDSSVSIVLRAERSGDRIPVAAKFSAAVHSGPEINPISYTISIGSFPEVQEPRRDMDYPPPPRAEVTERVELNCITPLGTSRLFWGKMYLYILPHGILRQKLERKIIYIALGFWTDRNIKAFDKKGNVHLM
jgi:hypothetical protein